MKHFSSCPLAVLLALATVLAPLAAQTEPKRPLRPGQYKRVHQHALDLILAEKAQECIERLSAYVKEHGDDSESHFMLTLAHAHAGDLDEAEEHMKKAISLGLDPARFLALGFHLANIHGS